MTRSDADSTDLNLWLVRAALSVRGRRNLVVLRRLMWQLSRYTVRPRDDDRIAVYDAAVYQEVVDLGLVTRLNGTHVMLTPAGRQLAEEFEDNFDWKRRYAIEHDR